eukprot:756352-Hanusia_phi.AAC.2
MNLIRNFVELFPSNHPLMETRFAYKQSKSPTKTPLKTVVYDCDYITLKVRELRKQKGQVMSNPHGVASVAKLRTGTRDTPRRTDHTYLTDVCTVAGVRNPSTTVCRCKFIRNWIDAGTVTFHKCQLGSLLIKVLKNDGDEKIAQKSAVSIRDDIQNSNLLHGQRKEICKLRSQESKPTGCCGFESSFGDRQPVINVVLVMTEYLLNEVVVDELRSIKISMHEPYKEEDLGLKIKRYPRDEEI